MVKNAIFIICNKFVIVEPSLQVIIRPLIYIMVTGWHFRLFLLVGFCWLNVGRKRGRRGTDSILPEPMLLIEAALTQINQNTIAGTEKGKWPKRHFCFHCQTSRQLIAKLVVNADQLRHGQDDLPFWWIVLDFLLLQIYPIPFYDAITIISLFMAQVIQSDSELNLIFFKMLDNQI